MSDVRRYYGKYRGTVLDTQDPHGLGRLRALVPGVHGLSPGTWALPCLPSAGLQFGLVAIPPPGANVWIEFEDGDIDHPIWTGCFWLGRGDVPQQAPPPGASVSATIQTPNQTALIVSDDPSHKITLRTGDDAQLQINSSGITITNGSGATIRLSDNSIDINDGALKVT